MVELVDFLLARITEDERWARALDETHPDETWNALIAPQRLLAQCDAKRRLIAECTRRMDPPAGERVLRYVALPYAEHPAYRRQWRP